MRSVWLTALLVLCLLSAGWILVQDRPGGAEGALASVLHGGDPTGAVEALLDGSGDGPAPTRDTAEPTFYRYTDESGSVRFVTSLAEVPRHLRDEARPVTSNRVQRAEASAPRERPGKRVRAEPLLARNRDVIVYTTSWCGWCRKTLAFLDENGIDYENRDIEVDDAWRQELRQKTGGTSIPVVEIDGQIIRGYDPKRIQRLLQAS
jgi:glutaredoxin